MKRRQFKRLMNKRTTVVHKIKIGQTVTVLGWNTSYKNNSYVGDELEVVAIDYPFIKVRMDLVGLGLCIETLDLRVCDFKVLNKNFINVKEEK